MSSKRLGVFFIHGMGSPDEGFSNGLERRIKSTLGEVADQVAFRECWWSPIIQQYQDQTWKRLLQGTEMDAKSMRKWVISSLGDPVGYLAGFFKDDKPIYKDIHECVRKQLSILEQAMAGSSDKPIVILAHSLGSVIMSNYMWDEQTEKGIGTTSVEKCHTAAAFITYGSNIPLFLPPRKEIKCIKFPFDELPATYRKAAGWVNIYDPDDLLGYPLSTIWTETQRTVISDTTINAGMWPVSETPFSHTMYDKDDDFIAEVMKKINAILAVTPTLPSPIPGIAPAEIEVRSNGGANG